MPAQSVGLFSLLSTVWLHHQEWVFFFFHLRSAPPYIFKRKGLFNKGSVDSLWGKQEMVSPALRMHDPTNQLLSVNVGNTVYFQLQASFFFCRLPQFAYFILNAYLTPLDLMCRLFSCTFWLSLNDSQPAGIKMHPWKKSWCHLSEAGTI